MINIEVLSNGYIVSDSRFIAPGTYCPNSQILFERLLLELEFRHPKGHGESYGAAFIADKPGQIFTAPNPPEPI
jgi:hypothetical protein